ncbi:CHAD domain-containing protein [Panacibacter ginsenosidivorans]|uniref:CHAD domain-containing protein n=1 Tax=Panacibacter ginsenosidivorans TaxID=1813871 RepID=A0A5B8V4Z8_9BACT|nr:CHAD domain-containing protein [Panacibacter ginsenosidivorans]QEC66282.1 CHAD domain-containing protein [Panacibacter ginsenosidivorans]
MDTPLEKYFAQRVKNLFNNLHDFELNGDEVSMHDLRVEIKKLRAIIKFLGTIYPKQQLKKTSHLLRSIFQKAGEIRESQLLQQWLHKHQFIVIENTYFPKERLDFLIADFRKYAPQYKEDFKEIIEVVSKFVHGTNEILAEQYFTDINAQVEKLCRRNLPDTEWHELRKLIKQRIYAYNWVRHEHESEDSHFAYYNKLQENIGLWHDLEIIKDNFSQKQVYLSQEMDVQIDFNLAWEKLTSSHKYRERNVEEMLSKQLIQG